MRKNYMRKKLKEDTRRRRGPIIKAVAENVLRKQRPGRSQTSFEGGGFDNAEIGSRFDPSSGISIKMLPRGFDRSAFNRVRSVI